MCFPLQILLLLLCPSSISLEEKTKITKETSTSLPSSKDPVDSHSASGEDSEDYEEYEDEENYEDYEEESPNSVDQTNHTIVYKSSLNEGDDKNNRTMGIPQSHGIAHKPGRGGDGKAFEEYKGSQNSVIQTKHVMVYKPTAGEGMSNSTEGVQGQDNDYNLKMHRSSKNRKRKKRKRKRKKKRRKRKKKRKRRKKRKSKRKKKSKGKKPTIPKSEIDMRGRSLTEPKDPNNSR